MSILGLVIRSDNMGVAWIEDRFSLGSGSEASYKD